MARSKLSVFDMRLRETISSNLKRLTNGMTQEDLSNLTGIPQSTLSGYFAKRSTINAGNLQKIADALNVSKEDIDPIRFKSQQQKPQSPNPDLSKYGIISLENRRTKKIPILGEVACGVPIYAEETYNDYVEVDENIKVDFALRTRGDSMIGDNIVDGDVVLVKKVSMVEPHEIAVVVINDEATLKRVKYDREKDILILEASNPSVPTKLYSGSELEQINILGKVVLLQRKL